MRHTGRSNQIDMLQGTLADKILLFALPLAMSGLLQQMFNAADTAVVGRFASSEAMAAVGSNTPVVNLILNLFIGLSVGANVVLADAIGRGRRQDLPKIIGTTIALALLSGVILIALGEVVIGALLSLLGLPDNVFPLALLYMRVFFLGMPFFMLYNFGAAVLRSKGDSRRPFIALTVSGVVNVGLNLFFVIVLHMDVVGVALATVISAGVSAAIVLHCLTHEADEFRLLKENIRLDRRYIPQMVRIGLPAGLQGAMFSLSNVLIQSGINSLGSDAMAGNTAGATSQAVMYFVINSFTQTAVTFTGQNYGAGNASRCKKVLAYCMMFAVLATAVMSVLFVVLRVPFVRLFTTDEAVMDYALRQIMMLVPLYILVCSYDVTSGAIRGMHFSLYPAIVSLLGTCVLRIIWVLTVFERFHTYEVLLTVYPVTWTVTGTVMIVSYFMISRKAFARIKRRRAYDEKT